MAALFPSTLSSKTLCLPFIIQMEIKADQYRSAPLQLPGSTSAGRVICGSDLAECVSVPGDFLRPQGAFPPGFYLLQARWAYCPNNPEVPIIRGMPTGP